MMVREIKQMLCPIYEETYEEVVSTKGVKSLRIARFLRPRTTSLDKGTEITRRPIAYGSFSRQNIDKWPIMLRLAGWKSAPKEWRNWFEKLKLRDNVKRNWIEAGIYDAISASLHEVLRNHKLLLSLAEFWCSETNTFMFPWGEATITLEDVMVLGGLPLLGEPVTKPVKGDSLKIVNELVKVRSAMRHTKAKKATYGEWMKHFMDKGDELEHVAFLSMWLSRFVFPDKLKEDIVQVRSFPIAVRLSKGTAVSLAPAVLASLYRDLRLITHATNCDGKSSISISAPFQLIHLWALERFDLLAASSAKPLDCEDPRVARWNKVRVLVDDLKLLRSMLSLAENFTWRPYALDVDNWEQALHYKLGEQSIGPSKTGYLAAEIRCYLRSLHCDTLIGIDGFKENYQPHRVARQFGYDQDLPGKFLASGSAFLHKVAFYIPSRDFEPGVSRKYHYWWSGFMSAGTSDRDENGIECISAPAMSSDYDEDNYDDDLPISVLKRTKSTQRPQNVAGEFMCEMTSAKEREKVSNQSKSSVRTCSSTKRSHDAESQYGSSARDVKVESIVESMVEPSNKKLRHVTADDVQGQVVECAEMESVKGSCSNPVIVDDDDDDDEDDGNDDDDAQVVSFEQLVFSFDERIRRLRKTWLRG